MDKNKGIDNKIKKVFDAQNKSAPADLWDKLSDSLPDPVVDKNIEEKIKTVFEKLDQTAPPQVWGNVNKQLNIDRVWERISEELDRRPVIYWRNIASVALFLLLLSGGIYLYNKNNDQLAYNDNTLKIENTISNIKAKKITEAKNVGQNIVTDNKRKRTQKSQKHSSAIRGKNSFTTLPGYNNNNNNNKVGQEQNFTDVNSSNNANIVKADPQEKQIIREELNSEPLLDSLPFVNLTAINTFPIKTTNDSSVILNLSSNNIENVTDKVIDPLQKKRFELGLTYSYNNTWILNSETQQSFNPNSLTKTSLAFANSYGIVANYNFSEMHALSTEFYVNSKSQQQYGEFIEGNYYIHTLQFNYAKITLLYQLNINQSSKRKIPSKYTVKTGFYGSYLKNFTHIYNHVIDMQSDKYTKNDYGVKIALGQEKKFRNIIMGYGLNGEYGFNNNFAGNGQLPAAFNVTKNALIGVYFNLKYNF